MCDRIRSLDWAATPLGPLADWPGPLRTGVVTVLASDAPMFLVWGPERILLYNDAYGELLGEKHPDALGRSFFSVWPEQETTIGPILEQLSDGMPRRVDGHTVLPRDRRPRKARIGLTCNPVYDERLTVAGALCIGRGDAVLTDTGDRADAETGLLARVVENSPEFIGICDADGHPVWVNDAGLAMVGMRREEARSQPLADWFMMEDGERFRSGILPRVLQEGPWTGELRFQHRFTGHPIPVQCHVYRVPDADRGELIHIATVARDESRSELADAGLRESEERFRALVEATASMVWTATNEGVVAEDSPSWRAFTGQTREEWLGPSGWLDPVHPDEKESVLARWEEAQRSGTPLFNTIRIYSAPMEEYRWTIVRGIPLKNPDGSIRGWVGMNTDITERHRAEEQLREADRRKDEFLALLGHELRNPLTPIASAAQLLELKKDSITAQELEQISATLSRQTNHLTRMVGDLLDLSRLDRGRINLQQETVDLRDLVPQAVESIPVLQEEGGFDFGISLPDDALMVHGDPVRLVQVLANLLDNATKYTPPRGWIRVEASREGDEVLVRVRDSGKGIDPDALSSLFEPFERGTSRESPVLGLGLGLPLVKRLVELHGGSIEARSPGPGMGSVFSLRLPAQRPEGVREDAPGSAATVDRRGRVLLVEDHEQVARLLRMLLETLGQEVRCAATGREALEAAVASPPGLALIDIGLPDISGFELARELRRTLGSTPLVALSGHPASHFPDDLIAVFDDYLVKPPELHDLQRALARMADS